jgi:lauroyl/myristoyl acyltransferase
MQSILGRSSIGIVADRDFSGHGIPAAFLGMRMTVPSAYATLAAAAGVPVIPCFCLRHDDGKYHLVVERPISIPPDNKEAARAIVEGYLKILEKHVEKYTEQWYFFQRVGGNSGSCH